MRSLLAASVLIVLAFCDFANAIDCGHQKTLEADQCAKNAFFLLNPDYDNSNVEEYCKQVKNSVDCVTKFNKECSKQGTTNLAIRGMRNHYKSVCTNPVKKIEFVQKTQFIKKENSEQLYRCVQSSISNMNYISDHVVLPNQGRQQNCCNYQLTRKCLSDKIIPMTNESNRKLVEDLTNEIYQPLMSFLCSKQNSIEACESKLKSGAMDQLKETFNKNADTKGEFKSFLIPFLNASTYYNFEE